jgi:hypothetical protein
MPRTNIDYSNTIIYKICSKDLNITELYVGHTTDMRRRKNNHKSSCNKEETKGYNYNVYQFIRANGGWDNWDMIEIERFEAIDGYDAKKRERYWIEELKATLNMTIPLRTQKQYTEDNKEIITGYRKEWRENNKEYLKEYDKNRKNKEERAEKNKEKTLCECGCILSRIHLARHKQSKKHIELMTTKADQI